MHSATNCSSRIASQLWRLSRRGSRAFKWRDRCCLQYRRSVPTIGLQGGLFQRTAGWEACCHDCYPWRHDFCQLDGARDPKCSREAWPSERGQCGSRCLRQQSDKRYLVRLCRLYQGCSKLSGQTEYLCEDCTHRYSLSLTGTQRTLPS